MSVPRESSETAVQKAIQRAERILPGHPASDGAKDPRWQAIIAVGEYTNARPLEVWRFARKWGAHANKDLRTAIATCLLEHLLEYHFEQIIPLVEVACDESRRFADIVPLCFEFGQIERPENRRRFHRLLSRIRKGRL